MSILATVETRNSGSSAPALPDTEGLGIAFLGPNALAALISAVEMGIVIAFFVRFLARSERERSSIKFLVYFLTFVATLQTLLTSATWWKIFVQDFGNWSAAAVPSWPQKFHSALTTVLAVPVQLFLIWRCRNFVNYRWFVVVPLVLMVIGTIVTTIYVTVILFLIEFESKNTVSLSLHTFFTCFVLSLAFSAAIDIAVTSILLLYLIRSRASVYTRRFRKVLSQLITITWESAVPPCGCAIAALIVCIRGGPFVSYWAVFLQVILGKLYLISLFVTLEARAKLATVAHHTHFPTLTNATRQDVTRSYTQDDTEEPDPTKQPDLPLELIPGAMVVTNHTAELEGSPDCPQAQAV
ncbi:hypothetical protein BJV78DRAFT_755619 [Lactifluus subvellereus]|nr:hypothetical protein BJV78DRAFT_755619 [Lactifluus subvellereus]